MLSLVGKHVKLALSGRKQPVHGKLIDIGNDILVIYNGVQFLYIPLIHLQHVGLSQAIEGMSENDAAEPDSPFQSVSDISYRKILMNAKGMFIELCITGDQHMHGYLTSIMNDYFVFHSPIFRNVYVSMNHLKYLIPYPPNVTPYSLKHDKFPIIPSQVSLARTFDQQLKKLETEFIVIDFGEVPYKIGQLKSVQNGLLELITSSGEPNFLHVDHVKTVHLP